MCANTSIGQLIKVPNLLEHYKEHKNEEVNFSISFIEFIKLHYSNNSHCHQNDHHDLPFKTIETFSFVIGLVSFEKFQIQFINEQNFIIKHSKTRLQKQGYKQEVTGLIVNQKPNVDSRYISELRKWIYLWEKYGLTKANSYFTIKYIADKGHVKKGEPRLENVVAGKLEFLKMVKAQLFYIAPIWTRYL
jgi:hypothetical protein